MGRDPSLTVRAFNSLTKAFTSLTNTTSLAPSRKVKFFSSVDDFMTWYNCVRPHGAFHLSKLETHIGVFYDRLAERNVLVDPEILVRGGVE